MTEEQEDGEWVDVETDWEAWEVNRYDDSVYLSFSNRDGHVWKTDFAPEDALAIGIAMAQAAQEPKENEE